MTPTDDETFRLTSERATTASSGKDELNLAEFPIALVTDRVPAGEKTLRFEDRIFDDRKNQYVTRRLLITAADEYGLPTAKDDEVILGLIQLTRRDGFKSRTVSFSRSDLIRLLGWPDTGPSYKRLTLSFRRWLGVTLSYDNAWWDKAQQRWTTVGFHIIESFELNCSAPGPKGQLDFALSRFVWNEAVFRSFQAGNLKLLDLDFYLGLTLPTSKRIYRFLDKRFYHRPEWDFDLKEFALTHVGLSRKYEGNIQLARKLEPAIRELEEKGFLAPLPPEERFAKSPGHRAWRIRFVRQGLGIPAVRKHPTEHRSELVLELVNRGVTLRTATELVGKFTEGLIREKLKIHDWLSAQKDGAGRKNPAGFLVQSIRDDYPPPPEFKAKAEQARRRQVENERALKVEEERRRRESEQEARERAEEERVEAYWKSLSPEAQATLWANALSVANPFYASRYRKIEGTGNDIEKVYRKMILHGHVLNILDADGCADVPETPSSPSV